MDVPSVQPHHLPMGTCAIKGCCKTAVLSIPTIVDPVELCLRHAEELGIRVLVPSQRLAAAQSRT